MYPLKISLLPAIHNWHGDVRCGLSLDVGDSVEILEECPKWFRGTCPRKSRDVGIFPKTYIHIKDLSKIDPVVAECTQVLREWSEIWKKLFVVSIRKCVGVGDTLTLFRLTFDISHSLSR